MAQLRGQGYEYPEGSYGKKLACLRNRQETFMLEDVEVRCG